MRWIEKIHMNLLSSIGYISLIKLNKALEGCCFSFSDDERIKENPRLNETVGVMLT